MKTTPKTYSVQRLTVWQRTEGETETTFGDAVSLAKRLMTVTDNPTVISDDINGDGEVAASYNANMGGTVEYGLTDLTSSDRVLFYGETSENGTNKISTDDIGSYVVTAHLSKQKDGNNNIKFKLTKYMRVLFAPGQEQEQQTTKSGVNWSTTNLSGTYSADPETGVYKYVRDMVDPVKDKALIEKWFTEAEYHGEAVSGSEATINAE